MELKIMTNDLISKGTAIMFLNTSDYNKCFVEPKTEYDRLLKSGMFFEFYPELTGEYTEDRDKWLDIYKRNKK